MLVWERVIAAVTFVLVVGATAVVPVTDDLGVVPPWPTWDRTFFLPAWEVRDPGLDIDRICRHDMVIIGGFGGPTSRWLPARATVLSGMPEYVPVRVHWGLLASEIAASVMLGGLACLALRLRRGGRGGDPDAVSSPA